MLKDNEDRYMENINKNNIQLKTNNKLLFFMGKPHISVTINK